MNVNETLSVLVDAYGERSDGNAPTAAQWARVLERDPELPFVLVNFFKFNAKADYGSSDEPALSGREAFQRYADVSVPSMQKAGGEFLAVAPFAGSFIGQDQDWDLIAIGKYPNLKAFVALYGNQDYIRAFRHRTAAVERQAVIVMEQ
ncbi:MAG: DUF1330 domain-containing protein [Alphaproteobacteria bacterium]